MVKEIIDNGTGTCNGCRNCGAGCTCGMMHGYNGHPLLRIVLALIILGFVFAGGVKLGELKAALGMGYQHHFMGDTMRPYDMGQGLMMPVTTTVVSSTRTATPTVAPTK
jgi:hypothetical protein